MSRALLLPMMVTLCLCARAARAQDDTLEPPAPEDTPVAPEELGAPESETLEHGARPPVAEPPVAEPPVAEPPIAEPPERSTEPAPAPPAPAEPSQQPMRRYEGQISSEGGSVYDDEGDTGPDGEDSSGGGGGDLEMPGFAIRIDPFNWLLEGRLGIELEVVAWKFITVELVPVFVANTEPPSLNLSDGREDPISQHSNGLGPIAGASLGVGFWLTGTPLRGYVLRAALTDYNYTYEAADSAGVFDRVSHADRRFIASIGSYSRFGFFTIGGNFGLGYELNQSQRCVVNAGSTFIDTASSGCPNDDELIILASRDGSARADLNGNFHPVYIVLNLSLGVAFD